jgi:hypothetical protein
MPLYVGWALTLRNGRLGCINSPQHKTSRWKKDAAFCGTPDSPMPMSGAPSRWICQRRWPLARRLFAPDYPDFTLDSPDFTPDSPVVFPPWCHLELAVRATVPSAPDSPACGTGQSAGNTSFFSWTPLDLHNVLFWGVAFLNVLVQVTFAFCELQTQTLANTLVHRLC